MRFKIFSRSTHIVSTFPNSEQFYIRYLDAVEIYENWLEENIGPRYYKYRIFGIGFIKTWTWYSNRYLVFYDEGDLLAFKLRFGV